MRYLNKCSDQINVEHNHFADNSRNISTILYKSKFKQKFMGKLDIPKIKN